jgi:hypothetical protein
MPKSIQIQMIHALKLSDQVARTNFAVDMLERTDASPDFLHQAGFSDEATFPVSGAVNRYNCRIWGSQNPHVTQLGERQPQSEYVGWLNAQEVDWTIFLYRKDCDWTFVLGHAGAVCSAPITTSNYPPTRWGAATFLPPC